MRLIAAAARRLAPLAALLGLLLSLTAGCGSNPAPGNGSAAPAASGTTGAATPAPQPATGADVTPPAADPLTPERPPIAAGTLELTPVADTSIACYPQGARSAAAKESEQHWNYGKSQQVKIKRQENVALLKFDFAKVPAGATLASAELIVTMANGKAFNHMAVYSLHVDWNEGDGDEKAQTDADTGACFLGPKGPASKWRAYDASDFSHAAAGNGGNLTSLTRAKDLGNGKWSIVIDPAVIHAAIADGQTLVLNEETGAWSDKYSNAFIFSREAGPDKQPVLKLAWAAGRDTKKPAFLGPLVAKPGPRPGSLLLNLPQVAADAVVFEQPGPYPPAVGYTLAIDGQKIPQTELPRPAWHHREIFLTGLPVGKPVNLLLTAFDAAGNTASLSVPAVTGGAWDKTLAQPAALEPIPADNAKFDNFRLQIVDGLTLFDPRTGGLSAFQERAEFGKPAFDARRLQAVRGDIVGFQVLITLLGETTELNKVRLELSDFAGPDGAVLPGAGALFHREHFVKMTVRGQELWAADPMQVLGSAAAVAIPSQDNIPDQRLAAYYVDLHVPLAAKPGRYAGHLLVTQDEKQTKIPMAIDVADLALPDELTFLVEMNAYGHANKELFHQVYRAFHAHRLSYNCLPYGHSRGISDDTLLPLTGAGKELRVSDWAKYDELYGPIFTGAVAKGLPRDGAPASHWYLPFNEGWPVDLQATDPHKACWEGRVAPNQDKKAYEEWLDRCLAADPLVPEHFSDTWRDGTAAVAKQFAQHAEEQGWNRTVLQFFSNHKMYFASGSISLWVMDEPQYGRDYRALDWLYAFYARAVAGTKARFELRGDISRPAWMGDRYDEALDLTVSSASIELDREIVSRRQIATGKPVWWYGGAGDASTDPAAMTALFIRKWSLGCDGGLPNWTAVSGDKSWDKTDGLRYIVYDPKTGAPQPTMRMKACREGQEMMELINQLAAKPGFNRWQVADLVNKEFSVKIVTVSKNPDDPGYSTFEGLDSAALDRLRQKLIATLLAR